APMGSTLGPTAWSPDGRWLYFARRNSGTGLDLYRFDLSDGSEEQLSQGSEGEYGGLLSPDGQHLAHYLETEQRCDVAVLELATGERRILTADEPGWHYVTSWSPDGRLVAVHHFAPDFESSTCRAVRVADGWMVPLALPEGAREPTWGRQ
ncbi:MAG TPA: hypothetical protein VGC54_14025, partial [Planctomycetota bacterium]